MSDDTISPVSVLSGLRDLADDMRLFTFVDDDGRDCDALSVRDLTTGAENVAQAIQAWGMKPGDRLVLVYPPSLDFITALVGCLVAGVVPVPVYPPDPFRLKRDIATFSAIVENSGARAALTNRAYYRARTMSSVSGAFSQRGPRWPQLPWYRTDRLRRIDKAPLAWHEPSGPDEPAILQYTSGSTAAPKGVIITHGNLVHEVTANARDLGLGQDARGVFWVPQYHDLGLISVIMSTIAGNSATHLMSPLTFLRRPSVWFDVMSRVGATHTAAPNFAFDLATRKTTRSQRSRWDLSALRVVMSAAEPIRPATMSSFYEAFAPTGLRADSFYPAYGLAEHTVSVSVGGRITLRLDKDAVEQGRVIPADHDTGRSVVDYAGCGPVTKKDARVRIVDPETRRVAEPGRIGEIWVHSVTKALGYFGMEEETATTFRATLLDEDDPTEYLRTGDLGFFHDGELFVTGRLKDLIIIRGRNVYPLDVEDSVRGCHPLIRPGGVAAFAVPSEEGDRLAVFVEVTKKHLARFETAEIVSEVRTVVHSDHQLACHSVVVGKAGLVKKTTSGKVRRRACAQAFLSGDVERSEVVMAVSALPVVSGLPNDDAEMCGA